MVVMAGAVTEATEVDEEAAVAMAVAVVVDVGDTEMEGEYPNILSLFPILLVINLSFSFRPLVPFCSDNCV